MEEDWKLRLDREIGRLK